jgi:hypothetical protein
MKMEKIVPPKRRLLQDLHGVTSQKTAFFIVTAVKNLKSYKIIKLIELMTLYHLHMLCSVQTRVNVMTRAKPEEKGGHDLFEGDAIF